MTKPVKKMGFNITLFTIATIFTIAVPLLMGVAYTQIEGMKKKGKKKKKKKKGKKKKKKKKGKNNNKDVVVTPPVPEPTYASSTYNALPSSLKSIISNVVPTIIQKKIQRIFT